MAWPFSLPLAFDAGRVATEMAVNVAKGSVSGGKSGGGAAMDSDMSLPRICFGCDVVFDFDFNFDYGCVGVVGGFSCR